MSVTASTPEVCFSAAEICIDKITGKCKRIHLENEYFLRFQAECGRETLEAITRMKELDVYDQKRRVQLKWYACESGKSRSECAKTKKKTVCNNLHHALAYEVKQGVEDGVIKLQDPKDDATSPM